MVLSPKSSPSPKLIRISAQPSQQRSACTRQRNVDQEQAIRGGRQQLVRHAPQAQHARHVITQRCAALLISRRGRAEDTSC